MRCGMIAQLSAILLSLTLSGAMAQDGIEQGQAKLSTQEKGEQSSDPAVQAATLARAERALVQGQVPLSGTLVAREEVLIYPQVSGFEITEIMADIGDQVAAGAVLARLSDMTLRAQKAQADAQYQRAAAGVGQAESQINSAEASLTQAAAALSRARALRKRGNASQAALDQAVATEASARAAAASAGDGLAVAQAALAQAGAARDIADLNLQRTEITAPVAGMVVDRAAKIGALAGSASGPLFTLIAAGEIELEAEVIETALKRLSVGDRAELQIAGLGALSGEVRRVPASVNAATRLGLVRIALPADLRLRRGVFASGAIITDERDAITVPATAVLSASEGDIVQVVKDGRIETRRVRAGLLWQGRREIAEGLAEGEEVIARAGAFFRDGDRVAPVEPAQLNDGVDDAASSADTGAVEVQDPVISDDANQAEMISEQDRPDTAMSRAAAPSDAATGGTVPSAPETAAPPDGSPAPLDTARPPQRPPRSGTVLPLEKSDGVDRVRVAS